MTFPIYSGDLPDLTTAQMVEVDRLMIEEYRIELIQMMESAGRTLAHLARERFLDGDARGKKVIVLAGTGGNGGGALVCARRLSNWGSEVQVLVTGSDDRFALVPGHQLDILRRMGVAIQGAEGMTALDSQPCDLTVDGIIGYSLAGSPRGAAARLIRSANDSGASILALDAPSGLDATSGAVYDPAIRATATLTLALPKRGLRAPGAEAHVGELYLADIGVPPSLYAEPSLGVRVGHLFAQNEIVRLQ